MDINNIIRCIMSNRFLYADILDFYTHAPNKRENTFYNFINTTIFYDYGINKRVYIIFDKYFRVYIPRGNNKNSVPSFLGAVVFMFAKFWISSHKDISERDFDNIVLSLIVHSIMKTGDNIDSDIFEYIGIKPEQLKSSLMFAYSINEYIFKAFYKSVKQSLIDMNMDISDIDLLLELG